MLVVYRRQTAEGPRRCVCRQRAK